jgi:hypothetical protein
MSQKASARLAGAGDQPGLVDRQRNRDGRHHLVWTCRQNTLRSAIDYITGIAAFAGMLAVASHGSRRSFFPALASERWQLVCGNYITGGQSSVNVCETIWRNIIAKFLFVFAILSSDAPARRLRKRRRLRADGTAGCRRSARQSCPEGRGWSGPAVL